MDNELNTDHLKRNEIFRLLVPAGGSAKVVSQHNTMQFFTCNRKSSPVVVIREISTLLPDSPSLYYGCSVVNRDLIVDICIEEHPSGETYSYLTGYPYIRFPETFNTPVEWNYLMSENIKVYCTSELKSSERYNCDMLQVVRRMEYIEHDFVSAADPVMEYYMAEVGLLGHQVLCD